jgi:DNA polymerase II small subunit
LKVLDFRHAFPRTDRAHPVPLETPARIVRELARRGYNAEREAVTLLAGTSNPAAALDAAVETAPDDALRLTAAHVRATLDAGTDAPAAATPGDPSTDAPTDDTPTDAPTQHPSVSTPATPTQSSASDADVPVETKGSRAAENGASAPATMTPTSDADDPVAATDTADADRPERDVSVAGDITGRSTGTGEYGDFVSVFRDRYETLSGKLRGRVNHRPASAIADMPGGSDAAMIGLVNDVRSSANGHWILELEDTTGTFPCLITKDRDIAGLVDELLLDECVAVEGTLSDDAGIVFVDALHFPDVPRTYSPSTADRHVQAALVSDVHVGSQEFMADAWSRFADWLHTDEAAAVEYLLIAGDMVEGVGVYPNQDEELDIVDIYDQYDRFSEHLKAVPGDLDIVMIPGNHDAVRLAEPQPGFDDELREIMSAHDPRIVGNPATITIEGVSVLMYHGVSLDEVIAELPEEKASYDHPHRAMYQLLKKRHVAPKYGGHMRLAPEQRDYLVVDDVPDIFHTGHVHKLGYGKYHNVLAVNSGCWQAQTAFQKSVNIDPDAGFAPIVDLDTLDLTVRKFA